MKKQILIPFRWKFLFVILPVAIIPVLVISILVSVRISTHLQRQSQKFYSELLTQVANNIDFVYAQYGMTFYEITRMDNFQKRINAPRFNSRVERSEFSRKIGEEDFDPKGGSVKRTVMSKIDGDFFLIELDKGSWHNDNYNINAYTATPYSFNIDLLQTEPLLTKIKEDTTRKMSFGKLRYPDSVSVFEKDQRPVFFYPVYINDQTSFSKFIFVILNKDLLPCFYEGIESLQVGTLYIIDETDTIVAQSHPSSNDYYEYDTTSKKYIAGDDDPLEPLSFHDYNRLNTDPDILTLHNVRLLFYNEGIVDDSMQQTPAMITRVKHNSNEYLVILANSDQSRCRLLFFLPMKYIMNPVSSLRQILLVVTGLIILIIVILSFYLSRYITGPVNKLTDALLLISQGKYPSNIHINTNDELQLLGDHFNLMVTNLQAYKKKIVNEQDEKKKIQEVTIITLAKLTEYYDFSTGRHLERVSQFTRLICQLLVEDGFYTDFLTDKVVDEIAISSILHDIGKIGIDSTILLKPGKVTKEEFEIIKKHTIIGGDTMSISEQKLGKQSFLTYAREICYYHHERWDGNGYPFGLKGDDIPLAARITALTDVYDALTNDRCYHKAYSHIETISIMVSEQGHFDPIIFNCFIHNQQRFVDISNLYSD